MATLTHWVDQAVLLRPHLTPTTVIGMAGVVAFLIVATCIGQALARIKPGKFMDTVNTRINAWWVMAGLLILTLVLGTRVFVVFMGLVSFLALKEFLSLVPTRRSDHRALFWTYGAIPVQYVALSKGWFGLFIVYIPLYHLLVGPLRLALRQNTKGFVSSTTNIHWGMMLTVFCLSHLAYMATLGTDINPAGGGAGLVLWLLLLTQLNDVSQFLWGSTLGERKILPQVSPNKTVVGLLGGVLNTTLLGALTAPYLSPFDTLKGALVGFFIGFAGFAGDIVMSSVKRDMGVKDTSDLIPGHGGILDRVDSLTYTAPVVFYIIYFGWL